MQSKGQKTFCPLTGEILTPSTEGTALQFRAIANGNKYPGDPESTLLFQYEPSEGIGKFHNTIQIAAYNPINPRIKMPCKKCGRQIVSYQRVNDNKSVSYTCLCGNQWTT